MDLTGTSIAVVGGDDRETEVARLAATCGADVRAHGFPIPDTGIEGVTSVATPSAALDGADIALFPIPGMGPDGSLFAPYAPNPIIPDEALLATMAKPGHIILGTAGDSLRDAAAVRGVALHEYESDVELMLLRGPAIVEGALEHIIRLTDVTIHDTEILIVGHGTIGSLLARTLVLLGGRITVAARNPVQRAAARAVGARAIGLEDMSTEAETTRILLSTVPVQIVTASILNHLPDRSVVVDLAAPPGGIDLKAAESMGHTAFWARGLGRRAPVTVGASQWTGIVRRIEAIKDETP
jgi:dipicolinate synthase subunit A